MRDYGVDKPDLRVPLKLTELTDVMKDVEFKVFSGPGQRRRRPRGGAVRARRRDDIAQRDRRLHGVPARPGRQGPRLDQGERARQGRRGPAVADREEPSRAGAGRQCFERTGAKDGDLIFFGADKAEACNAHLGALRQKVGHDRGLAQKGWRPLWVVDFPMFEYDEESKEWKARHHPFTSPKDGHEAFIATDQAKAYAKAYDMVLNGWEIAGGSVRIHRQEVQQQVFRGAEDLARGPAGEVRLPAATRCSTARRRTAASPSASTGW